MHLSADRRDDAGGTHAPAGRHSSFRITAVPPDIPVPDVPVAGMAADSPVERKNRRKKPPGPAARALKDLREKANVMEADAAEREKRLPKQFLSQSAMAQEIGWVGKDGKPQTSKYQWYEDDCPKKYLPVEVVEAVMGPLVERGIKENVVKTRLLGGMPARVVVSSRPARRAPVFARDAVRLIATGEIEPMGVGDRETFPAGTLRRWESSQVITGWENLPDDDSRGNTVLFEVDEGTGKVAVDLASRGLREGRSYVLATGPARDVFRYAKWTGGAMLDAEASGRWSVVPFDRDRDSIIGRVVLFLRRL